MLMKRFVLGLLSAGLCLNGLCSSPIPVPAPVKGSPVPIKAASADPVGKPADDTFSASVAGFSGEMLKNCLKENGGKKDRRQKKH